MRANLRATAACAALLLSGLTAAAQPVESAPEHSIKAAYLYNFAIYVDWPRSALGSQGSPITIGVLGDGDVAADLAAMARELEVHGRPIAVRQVRSGAAIAGLHMLFISRGRAADLPRLLGPARDSSVLIVTEWDGALEQGSVINFRLVDQRMRFEVSLAAAEDSGVSISSRMLAVAERVEPGSGQ